MPCAAAMLGVVGLGLGGYEVGAPPEPFADVFRRGKAAGLLSVPHAGETVGPEGVWGAVQALQADRIGHGVRAIEDPVLVELLRARQIPLEINPTSNICLHVYPDYDSHPFSALERLGLLVTVNSDDPPLFNTSLVDEYAVLATEFGYDRAGLARIARNAFAVSGAPAGASGGCLMSSTSGLSSAALLTNWTDKTEPTGDTSMSETISREIRLKSRPMGLPTLDNFELAVVSLPAPAPGPDARAQPLSCPSTRTCAAG